MTNSQGVTLAQGSSPTAHTRAHWDGATGVFWEGTPHSLALLERWPKRSLNSLLCPRVTSAHSWDPSGAQPHQTGHGCHHWVTTDQRGEGVRSCQGFTCIGKTAAASSATLSSACCSHLLLLLPCILHIPELSGQELPCHGHCWCCRSRTLQRAPNPTR